MEHLSGFGVADMVSKFSPCTLSRSAVNHMLAIQALTCVLKNRSAAAYIKVDELERGKARTATGDDDDDDGKLKLGKVIKHYASGLWPPYKIP